MVIMLVEICCLTFLTYQEFDTLEDLDFVDVANLRCSVNDVMFYKSSTG